MLIHFYDKDQAPELLFILHIIEATVVNHDVIVQTMPPPLQRLQIYYSIHLQDKRPGVGKKLFLAKSIVVIYGSDVKNEFGEFIRDEGMKCFSLFFFL